MRQPGGVSGFIVAIFLLILGVILVAGWLDWILWVLGAVCIVAAIVVGGMAIFGNKNRY